MAGFPLNKLFITDFISKNAKWYPDKTAIIYEEHKISWGTFEGRINQVASSLQKLGVTKGDSVAIVSGNCREYLEIMFGILKAGAVIVPLSILLTPEMAAYELESVNAKIVFFSGDFENLTSGYQKSKLALFKDIFVSIDGEKDSSQSYEKFLVSGTDRPSRVELGHEDPYNIIFSSGTTGAPKGIVHSHYGRLFFSLSIGLENRINNQSITLLTTPLYTNGTQLLLLPTIVTCGTVVIMPKFDSEVFLQLVQREKCTHTFMVPTQFKRIMSHPNFDQYDTSSMEVMLSSAAPLQESTKIDILNKFPATKLVEGYGVTEGVATVLRPNEQFAKLGSVGKPRIGGDIKIIDEEGIELKQGEIGEIIGYNAVLMTGYYNQPEKTEEVTWTDSDGQKYLRTGDMGRLDEDGYLYIVDRKKDMIISGGFNIFPKDIEEIIIQHPNVSECAVIGVPHEEWGETPMACVVKTKGSTVSEDELKNWVNGKVAKFQRVNLVSFEDELPRNALEKIMKKELRRRYWGDQQS